LPRFNLEATAMPFAIASELCVINPYFLAYEPIDAAHASNHYQRHGIQVLSWM
jgi:hypothetical protein